MPVLSHALALAGFALSNAGAACGRPAPANACWPHAPNLHSAPDYTKDAASCCQLCQSTPKCAGWTWGFDTHGPPGLWSCRLKNAVSGAPLAQNCTSGYATTAAPTPAPTSPKPHILYVLADE
jgi:hypothetical protein